MRNAFAGLTIFAALLGVSLAQEPRQPQPLRPGADNQARPGADNPSRLSPLQGGVNGQASTPDQQIAAFILGGAHNEVELAKFSQQRLQTQQARAFAEKMIRDHSADCEAFEKFAGHLAAGFKDPAHDAAPDAATRPDAIRPGASRPEGAAPPPPVGTLTDPPATATPRAGAEDPNRAAAAPPLGGRTDGFAGARAAGSHLDWVAIHRDIGKHCLNSTKQEFGRYQGVDFDKAYMGQQLAAHMKMVDELKVLRQHASPQLQPQIDKSLQVAQGHLQEARQVMEQIKDTPSERVSRRPEGNK
jgi:predicted outer membrane protein